MMDHKTNLLRAFFDTNLMMINELNKLTNKDAIAALVDYCQVFYKKNHRDTAFFLEEPEWSHNVPLWFERLIWDHFNRHLKNLYSQSSISSETNFVRIDFQSDDINAVNLAWKYHKDRIQNDDNARIYVSSYDVDLLAQGTYPPIHLNRPFVDQDEHKCIIGVQSLDDTWFLYTIFH